jgi:hypothetical protein
MALPMRSNNSIFRTSFSTLTQAMEIGWGGTRMLVSINLSLCLYGRNYLGLRLPGFPTDLSA